MRVPSKGIFSIKRKRWRPTTRSIIKFVRKNCFFMAPIWIFWTYIVSFLLSGKDRQNLSSVDKFKWEYIHPSGRKYKVEFSLPYTDERFKVPPLQVDYLNEIKRNANRAKIGRIYQYLGGDFVRNRRSTVIQRTKRTIKFWDTRGTYTRNICSNSLELGELICLI